jgi:hypothetical protein
MSRVRGALLGLVAYAVVFGVLLWPWARDAADAIPAQPTSHDARLIVWILGWVAYALPTMPTSILDAPIDHPAPRELAGSEHLATSQLVAAPVYWLTGNAVLAANAVAIASYPMAAFAMARLAAALGAGPVPAWTAGLVFALGPLRVPPSLQTVQLANLFLPVAALSLVRLRRRPDARRAVVAGLAITAGLFASYYVALLVLIVAGVWIVLDAPGEHRARWTALATAAVVVATAVLVLASQPWIARAAAGAPLADEIARAMRDEAWRYRAELVALTGERFGRPALVLALLGVAGVVRVGPPRRLAVIGAAFAVLGALLTLGPVQPVWGVDVPLPYALIAASPARFFRMPERFVVLAGFGTALLAAAALASVPARMRSTVAVLAAAVVLADRGPAVRSVVPDPVLDATALRVYARVRDVAGDDGALLELPIEDDEWRTLEPDAMVGNTIHHLPLLTGYTGYRAAHRPLLLSLLARLPDVAAWNAIVDLTHVRWLLLRPAETWRDRRVRDALATGAGTRVAEEGGWTLVRVGRRPERPEWFAALAAGPRPGHSVLGTPLAALDAARASAAIALVEPAPTARVRNLLTLALRVENTGTTAWPVSVPADLPETGVVELVAEWRAASPAAAAVPPPQAIALPWDVAPKEALRIDARVGTPPAPGAYVLSFRVSQRGAETFAGSPPLAVPLEVAPGVVP